MDYRVDGHAVVFAAGIALLVTGLMSIIPVRLVLGANAQDVLRENTFSGAG